MQRLLRDQLESKDFETLRCTISPCSRQPSLVPEVLGPTTISYFEAAFSVFLSMMDLEGAKVWQSICYRCDSQTLKSLRFVNLAINEFATQALFQEIYVAILGFSLDNLSNIANHSVLRHYVKRLLFCTQLLDQRYCAYEGWKTSCYLSPQVALSQAMIKATSHILSSPTQSSNALTRMRFRWWTTCII